MKLLNFTLVFSTLFFFTPSFIGQQQAYGDVSMEWGDMSRSRGNLEAIVSVQGRNFSTVINRRNFFNGLFPNSRKLVFRSMSGLSVIQEDKIRLRGNGKKVAAQNVIDLGSEVITLSSRRKFFSGQNEIYFHSLNASNLQNNAEGTLLKSYFLTASAANQPKMGFVQSDHFKKVGGYFTIPVRMNDYPGLGYVLFDELNGLYQKDVVMLPYFQNQIEIYDQFIGDDGDFFVLAKEYYQTNPNQFWSPMNRTFSKIRVFKVIDGEFSEFEINHSGYLIQELKMAKDTDGNILCSGFYADDLFSGFRGVFMLKLDRKTNAVISEMRTPFSQDFVNAGFAAWERTWTERMMANASRQKGLGNFKMLDFRPTEDGGYIAISEHQEVEIRLKNSTQENAKPQYDYHYFYDDMIVYKLKADGSLDWVKRIPKTQQSLNDGGYYLSVSHAVTNKKVYLMYNDNKRNYLDDGTYENREFPRPANFMKVWNTIGLAEIDLNTGELSRRMLMGRAELTTSFVPKMSRYDIANQEMIVYGKRGNRHRFGRVSFK